MEKMEQINEIGQQASREIQTAIGRGFAKIFPLLQNENNPELVGSYLDHVLRAVGFTILEAFDYEMADEVVLRAMRSHFEDLRRIKKGDTTI